MLAVASIPLPCPALAPLPPCCAVLWPRLLTLRRHFRNDVQIGLSGVRESCFPRNLRRRQGQHVREEVSGGRGRGRRGRRGGRRAQSGRGRDAACGRRGGGGDTGGTGMHGEGGTEEMLVGCRTQAAASAHQAYALLCLCLCLCRTSASPARSSRGCNCVHMTEMQQEKRMTNETDPTRGCTDWRGGSAHEKLRPHRSSRSIAQRQCRGGRQASEPVAARCAPLCADMISRSCALIDRLNLR